jgi:hypothetical protein
MITPDEYELALLEKLKLEFAGSAVHVFGSERGHQHSVRGRYSLVLRQLDAAAYRVGMSKPFMIADAKRHSGKLDVKEVEMFIGMIDDVGANMGLLVAPAGFTKAAARRAAAASTHVWVMTVEEALTCKWLSLAREIYPHDWIFREKLALALRRLYEYKDQGVVVEALESIAFEEWESFVAYALSNHQAEAFTLLRAIAANHVEEGWRFNALRHLLNQGNLNQHEVSELLAHESDPSVRELLESAL